MDWIARRSSRRMSRPDPALFSGCREMVIQPHGEGMLMTTPVTQRKPFTEKSLFKGTERPKAAPDMIEIASLLIDKKVGLDP